MSRPIVLARVALGLTFVVLAALAAEAQPRKMATIGCIDASAVTSRPHLWEALKERLQELGYVEGQTVTFVQRWGGDRYDAAPALVAELLRLNVDVLVVAGSPAILAAKRATTTVPIVIASGTDPVGLGVADTLSRPGGNVTGVTTLTSDLSGKWLELLKELLPGLTRVGILWDQPNPGSTVLAKHTRTAADAMGLAVISQALRNRDDLDDAFAAMVRQRSGAVVVTASAMLFSARRRIAELATARRLPTISGQRENAEAGGLIAYGPNRRDLWRRTAAYVDKVLKGAKPADLPIEQPTTFELVINVKAAKALGVAVPPALALRADQLLD
jgi:putative tryptophan/tyrosine transport system substrate-binding protein